MSILSSSLSKNQSLVTLLGQFVSKKNFLITEKSLNVLNVAGYKNFPDPPKEKSKIHFILIKNKSFKLF